eukprot:7452750-Alexandrium_andersonii.AAC.1
MQAAAQQVFATNKKRPRKPWISRTRWALSSAGVHWPRYMTSRPLLTSIDRSSGQQKPTGWSGYSAPTRAPSGA